MRRLLTLLAVVAAVLLPAGTALAHAELLGTSPSSGAVEKRVSVVILRFDEPVSVQPASIQVTDPEGRRVDTGAARALAAKARVKVRPDMAGTYEVSCRVVSDDGHPVAGTFSFSVGHRSGHVPAARSATASLSAAYAVLRWLGYAGFCALTGGAAFVLLCWPGAAGLHHARLLAAGGGLVAWLTTWAALFVQGAYDDGAWSHLIRPDTLVATLSSRTGAALMARLLLVLLLGAALGVTLRWGPSLRPGVQHRLLFTVVMVALVTAATWSVAGHESVGSLWPVAVVSDAVHLTAAALWAGGLVQLFVLRRPPLVAVRRFSRMALPCVAVVAATGLFQAQRNLPGWEALVGSGYGWLVLAKVTGLVLLAGCSFLARRMLASVGETGPLAPARLHAMLAVEVGLALAVLGVAAVLVQTPPR